MEAKDVRVYLHPNAEIRSYLTSNPIMKPQVEAFENPLRELPDHLAAKLGTIGAQAARELLSLSGVAKIRIKPNEVIIRKVPHVSWDDMEEEVLRIMDRAVRKSRMHVMKR
ncbi:MAG: NifU N-terminal domain-containing protein [Thermodesulfobacteriota bacterium]